MAAANALKTLEEPPARTHFVLLTSRGRMMLDTIRSRAVPVRFAPLSDAVMRQILTERGAPEQGLEQLLELAGGCASAALTFSSAEETAAPRTFVDGVRQAIAAENKVLLNPQIGLRSGRRRVQAALRDIFGR